MKHLFVLLFLCAFFFVKAQDTVQFYMGVEYGRSELKGNIDQRLPMTVSHQKNMLVALA